MGVHTTRRGLRAFRTFLTFRTFGILGGARRPAADLPRGTDARTDARSTRGGDRRFYAACIRRRVHPLLRLFIPLGVIGYGSWRVVEHEKTARTKEKI